MPVTERVFVVFAHLRTTRALGIVFRALAALDLLYLGWNLLLDFLSGSERAPAIPVALGLVFFAGLPLALAAALDVVVRAELRVGAERVVLLLRKARLEASRAELRDPRLSAIPLPAPGVIALGRILCTRELAALVDRDHPMARFAEALPKKRALRRVLALGILPLLISVIVFRLQQVITYGSAFGEYHARGLEAYLSSFAIRWIGVAGALWVLAGCLRVAIELFVWAATWIFPKKSRALRNSAELLGLITYWAGVPGYLAYRLLF